MNRSYSERTQGTRLRRLQDLVLQISGFVNYNPPNPTDTLNELSALATNLEQAMLAETTAELDYRVATEERQKAFRDGEFSVTKTLKYIRSIAVVNFGKESRSTAVIVQAIHKIAPPTRKKPALAVGAATAEALAPTRSQSHCSYASMTMAFRELVQLLVGTNYQTNIPQLQLPNLQQFANQLTQHNNTVAQTATALENLRRDRDTLLQQADDAVSRVKNCIKYLYGVNSSEYLAVKPI